MSKTNSRICAFKIIYEYLLHDNFDYEVSLSSILDCEDEITDMSEEGLKYVKSIFDYVALNKGEINDKIQSHLKGDKTLRDIYALDYALLVLAIASIDYLNEDKSLIINEMVRVAKRYSTDKSYAFINGFLSSVYGE